MARRYMSADSLTMVYAHAAGVDVLNEEVTPLLMAS